MGWLNEEQYSLLGDSAPIPSAYESSFGLDPEYGAESEEDEESQGWLTLLAELLTGIPEAEEPTKENIGWSAASLASAGMIGRAKAGAKIGQKLLPLFRGLLAKSKKMISREAPIDLGDKFLRSITTNVPGTRASLKSGDIPEGIEKFGENIIGQHPQGRLFASAHPKTALSYASMYPSSHPHLASVPKNIRDYRKLMRFDVPYEELAEQLTKDPETLRMVFGGQPYSQGVSKFQRGIGEWSFKGGLPEKYLTDIATDIPGATKLIGGKESLKDLPWKLRKQEPQYLEYLKNVDEILELAGLGDPNRAAKRMWQMEWMDKSWRP